MANAQVPHVYKSVIEDVIRKCAEEFVRLGFDEAVLQDLKQTWEAKLIATRVAQFEGLFDVETLAAVSTNHAVGDPATVLHGTVGATSGLGPVATTDDYYGEAGSGYVYHQGAFQISQTDGQFDDALPNRTAHALGSSESILSVTEASSCEEIDHALEHALSNTYSSCKSNENAIHREQRRKSRGRRIGQVDGKLDDDDDDDDDEKSDDDGGINSDLDDDDSEDDEAEAEHFILCQYEKVGRTKNKWKCALKDGIVHVNGKDYLFSKANCDFEW